MITKFDNFLNESNITDIVYHRTNPEALISILKTGKILMSTSMKAMYSPDNYNKKPYYLSFSRIKNYNVGYGKGQNPVTIEFDGKQLKTKYKGMSVDYWSIYMNSDTTVKNRADSDEYEDRIFSNSPYLENLDKYIKNIDIIVNEDWTKDYMLKSINKIKKIESPLIKKIRVFKNFKDYNFNKNSIPILDFNTPEFEEEEEKIGQFDFDLLKKIITTLLVGDKNVSDNEYVENFIRKYIDIFIKKGEELQSYSSFNKREAERLKNVSETDIKNIRSRIQYQINWLENDDDFLRGMDAEIHNISKSYRKGELNYELLKILSDEMIKYKVSNIIDLIKAKRGVINNKKFIDYSKIYCFVYKQYDRYVIIDNNKETDLNWGKLRDEDKNKIWDMGYPIPTKNIINYLFNRYDENKAKEIINSIKSEYHGHILVDLRGKLIYKEITEKDYLGSDIGDDIGDRRCWFYMEKDNWWKFLMDNLGEKIYKEPLISKIMKLLEDDEVKIRFIWAVTEQLFGEEKTIEFFDENNLILRDSGDNYNPGSIKYILYVKGEKTEKQKYKEEEINVN